MRKILIAFAFNIFGTILITSIVYGQGTSEIFGQLNVKGTPASLTVDSSVGIGTSSPDNSAILDISSTTQGVLIPRMTTTERDAILFPVTGLQIEDPSGEIIVLDGQQRITSLNFAINPPKFKKKEKDLLKVFPGYFYIDFGLFFKEDDYENIQEIP